MIQRTAVALKFWAFFVEAKVGKTGLTVTVDVREGGTLIVTGAAATEVGGGLYSYTLASGSNDANTEYVAVFKTSTTTVDAREIPALWATPAWADSVDAAVSGRASQTSVDAVAATLPTDPADQSLLIAAIDAVMARLGAPAGASLAADLDAVPTAVENADALLKRDFAAVTGEAARSALNALRALRNKVSRAGATVTVTKEDDTAAAWTATVTTDASAAPVVAVDPT